MNKIYEIKFEVLKSGHTLFGHGWGVYKIGDDSNCLFKGTILEVEAWVNLKEKGFEL